MGRPRKTDLTNTEELTGTENQEPLESQESEEQEQEAPQLEQEGEAKEEVPARILEIMRLYPQYEELWITSRGFVHPVGSPQYLLKDAKLYQNKFYNK